MKKNTVSRGGIVVEEDRRRKKKIDEYKGRSKNIYRRIQKNIEEKDGNKVLNNEKPKK